MTDKDYLQIAKNHLENSRRLERGSVFRNLDVVQAQAAALIAIAERLSDLILAVTLLAKELQKHNERAELEIERRELLL